MEICLSWVQLQHPNIRLLQTRRTAMNLETLILVGKAFYQTTGNAQRFQSFEDLVEFLKANPISGPGTVLIKASRGMALERLKDLL